MRRILVLAMTLVLLSVGLVAPASAADTYHTTDHRLSAQFNNTDGWGSVQIYATWYSPESSSGDSWYTPESDLYVTYWGDRIGDDCSYQAHVDDWDMRWSLNHGYVAFDSPCGFFELHVQGVNGVEPDKEWSHHNEYWRGDHYVRTAQWNDLDTTAELYLDGQPLDVICSGATLSRGTSTIISP